MRKFHKRRPLADIVVAVVLKGDDWWLDSSKYDRDYSDYISIGFSILDCENSVMPPTRGSLLYNTFNGTFFGQTEHGLRFDTSSKLDEVKWYNELLDLFFEDEVLEEVARRLKTS